MWEPEQNLCTDLHERSELAASNTGCEAEMDEDETYDYDTPIEETPGYLGHIFDGFLSFSDGLKALDGFDFSLYGIMADELGQLDRQIEVQFDPEPSQLRFEAYSASEIVGAIPLVVAVYDCPPGQGPAGGSGYIFVLKDGAALSECERQAQILRNALDEDFEKLCKEYEAG